ncbi:aminoglycoside phosphotransferase family protein [Streptomyces sp. NPDC007107]|uniref:phosphotransferase enzyme family protein n=1 Tax=Streptomyces sp. NPDC007107 TaxID=3156915 RepID=UPI00340E98A1
MGMAPFTAEAFRHAMGDACRIAGLSAEGAELIHITVNAVFRLNSAPVVARVAGPQLGVQDSTLVVDLARWLENQDLPITRLAALTVDQPVITASGVPVTFWRYLPPRPGPQPTPAELAGPLRRLHALSPPEEFPLPAWDPLRVARDRLRRAPDDIPSAGLAFLHDLADRVAAELPTLPFALPRTVIHGDAHIGNMLRTPGGHTVLCDLDFMSLGPPEWDLVPELVGCLRYGRPWADYQRLVDAYGFDPRGWGGLPTLIRVHALNVLTVVLPLLRTHPALCVEWQRRVQAMSDGIETGPWVSYRRTI